MTLGGRTALVTGASRGLGRAIAYRLAMEGAAVAINYSTRKDDAESLAEEIRSAGRLAMVVQSDVGDEKAVRTMIQSVLSELGRVDILVNNAALLHRGDLRDFHQGRYDEMQRVNVGGIINTVSAVVDSMKQQRFGRIVNITSIAANGTALPGTTFYAATKAAVILLTRRFALDLGSYGITVNAVAPGFIRTDMTTEGLVSQRLDSLFDQVVAKTIVGRVGKAEDVAHAVAFLASPESGFITAQTLTVDGGRTDYVGHA
jgi:NAD(P)-dependent dehydrogenase (short-subunit alcohol dehydrogenase family)